MKRILSIVTVVFVAATVLFTSCGPKDTTGPKIYLLGLGNVILKDYETDTTVLLYTKFVDPGVLVEDNATQTANIIVTSNRTTVLDTTSAGYLKKVLSVDLIYTATDDELNVSTRARNITIANIANAFTNTYVTTRTTFNLNNDSTYNSNVVADTRVPGRLKFPKVYAHYWDGEKSYFKINADLYHPGLSQIKSESIGYMGTADDKERPFFSAMSYEQGIDSILCFTYLRIDAQYYQDSVGGASHQVYISGVEDQVTHLPLSRIEYLFGSKTVKRIVLELNVTKNGLVDRVTEVYTPY